jgi:hypothetical protein
VAECGGARQCILAGDKEGSDSPTAVVAEFVAEPPKLYGPHAPVIVSKTSDGYACTPDNLRRSVGCTHRTPIQLHLTTHTRINKGVTTTLQHLYKTLHQSAEE